MYDPRVPNDNPAPAIHDVRSPAELDAATARWNGAGVLAIDTEFMRERTFYARLALVQVAHDERAWLVDPLAVPDLAPLAQRLADPGTVKVLHSGSEDVDLMARTLGTVPRPLFDTQIAAAIAGVGVGLSLQKLVATLVGVELHKGETRTDWLARPLSEAQRAYAAEDVLYLEAAYHLLREQLAARGRLAWALEDAAALGERERDSEDPEEAWTRVKGAGRLNRRQLGVLKVLAAWREVEARRRDLPRSFVLREEILVMLAARQPDKRQDLYRLPGVDPRQLARDGATWIELIAQGTAIPEAELPQPRPHVPLAGWARDLEKRLRAVVQETAKALEIAPEVLASRRGIDQLLRWGPEPPPDETPRELRGWRREVIGERLVEETRKGWPDVLW